MSKARNSLLIVSALALVATAAFLSFRPSAIKAQKKGPVPPQTSSRENSPENYDIRRDKAAGGKIVAFRSRAEKPAEMVNAVRDSQVSGVETLRQRVASLKVEYNAELHTPEVIGPDVRDGKFFLTRPTTMKRHEALRSFIKDNSSLVGLDAAEIANLKTAADYTDPNGKVSFVELEQEIDGIPVFQGRVKAGFTKDGQLARVINNLAPGLADSRVLPDFGDPVAAAKAAASYIGANVDGLVQNDAASTPLKAVLGTGDFAPTAEKTYFPTEPGVVVPAWRVLLRSNARSYYVIVDASTGTLLWRKDLTDDQTQAATFNVYANPSAMINVAHSPFTLWPGSSSPNGTQGAAVARTQVTRIGNESPYTFNNNGWITDGGTETDGNAVEAGLDRDTTDGIDANSHATAANPVFDFPISPSDPNTNSGESPEATIFTFAPADVDTTTDRFSKTAHGLANGSTVRFSSTGTLPATLINGTAGNLVADKDYFVVSATANDFQIASTSNGTAIDITSQGSGTHTIYWSPTKCFSPGAQPALTNYQKAVVTQLFYIANWYHDETYRLGFTEAARNFQNDNFGRGGVANDRISAEAQDCSGTNNANFSTPADGGRGRMQMYVFDGANPDLDGALDAEVVVHELTHGLSNRLHGNADGLNRDIARGMGEGWSDFYALSMLSQPSDPVQGIYPAGVYASYHLGGSFTNNGYYGIRRFPYAVISFTGPNGKPHNPLTFEDIDNSKINLNDGAFAPRFVGNAGEVHNVGEVWCSMLWEVRGRMISRLGWSVGNRKILQLVTDAMKLAPPDPSFITERDALLSAAAAGGDPADVADIWAGFAARGLGASASIQDPGTITSSGGSIRVTQGFDLPNLTQSQNLTVSDLPGDADGYVEPGENININVPISNGTGQTATGVTATIVGGGTTSYGTLTGTQTVTQPISFTVPAGATCGAFITVTINVNSSLGPATFSRQIFVGKPATTVASQNFDGATAPALPSGWAASAVQSGINFVNSTTTPDTAPNTMFAQDPTSVGGGTNLTSPIIAVTSSSATVTFRHNYNTEDGWDGGVLEISINGNPFQDILVAGGSFTQNGYNSLLGDGVNNPLSGRSAWTGSSGGYITTIAQLPAAANGQPVQLRWRFGADNNTAVTGWFVDTISLSGAGFVTSYSCQVGTPTSTPVSVAGRALNPGGFGIRGVHVTLRDAGGNLRMTTTNAFGYYSFPGVASGQTVTLNAAVRGHSFSPVSVSVTAGLAAVNLVATQ